MKYELTLFQGQMIAQDKMEKERCDAKNAVEEYVYDMRDKLCGPLEEFSKEMVRLNNQHSRSQTRHFCKQ